MTTEAAVSQETQADTAATQTQEPLDEIAQLEEELRTFREPATGTEPEGSPLGAQVGTEPKETVDLTPLLGDIDGTIAAERAAAAEEAKSEAKKEAADELDAAERLRQDRARNEGISQAFRTREQKIRANLEADGLTPERVSQYAAEFEAHHAQIRPVVDRDWTNNIYGYVHANLPDADSKADFARQHDSGKIANAKDALDFLKANVETTSTKDRLTPTQAKALRETSKVEGRRELLRDLQDPTKRDIILSRLQPVGQNGGGAGAGARDAAWLNNLPPDEYDKVPVAERNAIWARG